MKVSKAPFKKAVDIVKRMNDSKNKENGQIMIQCFDGETILCYGKTDNIFSFHTLKNLDGTTFSFVVNPFDLFDTLGGKEKEKEYSIETIKEKECLVEKVSGKAMEIKRYEKQVSLPFRELTPLKNSEEFLSLLETAEKTLNEKSEKIATQYLKFGAKAALKADPICLQHDRLDEVFTFESAFLHLQQVKLLNKSLVTPSKNVRSDLSYCIHQYALVLKNEIEVSGKGKENDGQINYFMLKINHEIPFPTFDVSTDEEQEEKRKILSFTIDADEMKERLSFYGADCKDFYLYDKEGMLVIDPYGKKDEDTSFDEGEEKFPLTWMKYDVKIGKFKRAKINAVALKNLFSGYSGNVEVYQVLEPVNKEENMVVWRIYTPHRITSVIGKTEPNYDKVDAIIKELERKQKEAQEARKRSARMS